MYLRKDKVATLSAKEILTCGFHRIPGDGDLPRNYEDDPGYYVSPATFMGNKGKRTKRTSLTAQFPAFLLHIPANLNVYTASIVFGSLLSI